jgi:hypothetical protein
MERKKERETERERCYHKYVGYYLLLKRHYECRNSSCIVQHKHKKYNTAANKNIAFFGNVFELLNLTILYNLTYNTVFKQDIISIYNIL